LLQNQLELIQEKVGTPDVFFTDRVSRATVELARHFRTEGTIIYFEPSGIGDPKLFREMLKVTTVLKYSAQRARTFSDLLHSHNALLEIETLGEDGLRFRLRRNFASWHSLSAREVTVKDTAGSGDWTTIGFLSTLFKNGTYDVAAATRQDVTRALDYGQAIAALNCEFEGARGAMYRLTRSRFLEAVGIIEGKAPSARKERKDSLSLALSTSTICPSCKPKNSVFEQPVARPSGARLVAKS